MASDNWKPSDTVKDKLKTLRARMSAKDEVVEEEQKSAGQGTSKTNFGAKVKVDKDVKNVSSTGSSLTNLRTKVLVKITRRFQQMVHNHNLAFEFIQKLFNRLEERVAVVEENVVVEKEWVERVVQEQMQEVKVTNLEKEKEVLLRDIDETRQREMKGNTIISTRKEHQHLLTLQLAAKHSGFGPNLDRLDHTIFCFKSVYIYFWVPLELL